MPTNPVTSQPLDAGAPAELEFSIVLLLEHDRGLWRDSISSWAQRQTYPRHRYEVIVVTNGKNPAMEEEVRGLLQSHDSLLRCSSANEYDLFDLGARQAKGRYLFFSESHCLGDDACLSELSQFLSGTDMAGAVCNASGMWQAYAGELATRLHEEDIGTWYVDGDTHWLWLAGAAIRREIYLELGGFNSRYSLFADRELGIRLYERGLRLGYAEKAQLRHKFIDTFRELTDFNRLYTLGQHRYRSDFSEAHCRKYLGDSAEWLDRYVHTAPIAEARFSALMQYVLVHLNKGLLRPAAWAALPALLEMWLLKRFGDSWPLLTARLKIALSTLSIWCWRFVDREKSYSAFRQLILFDLVHYFRLKHLSEDKPKTQCSPRAQFDMNDDLVEHLVGFRALEHTNQGRAYRFTQRVSMLQVSVPPATYRIEIEIVPCRPSQLDPQLMVLFNGKRLRGGSKAANSEHLSFFLPQEYISTEKQAQLLALVCDPFRPATYGSEDTRTLGLAISSIRFLRQNEEFSPAGADRTDMQLK